MDPKQPRYSKTAQVGIIVGAVLIFFGIVKLTEQFFGSTWWGAMRSFFSSILSFVWPVALIGTGIFLLWAAKTGKFKDISFDSSRPLRRSVLDKRIAGVCGGIAAFVNVDSTVIRILWTIFFILNAGLAFLLYLVAALIIPKA